MTRGERLRAARKAAGLTVAQVAERTGYSPSGVRALENGQNDIRVEVAELLASVVRKSAVWLLTGQEKDAPPAPTASVPIAGTVGAGAQIEALEEGRPKYLELPVAWEDATAFFVKGDSCYPIYEHGDHIVVRGERRVILAECVNRMCVVETDAGIGLVKRVFEGSAGAFFLESPNAPPLRDVRLVSARPVLMRIAAGTQA